MDNNLALAIVALAEDVHTIACRSGYNVVRSGVHHNPAADCTAGACLFARQVDRDLKTREAQAMEDAAREASQEG